MRQTPYAPLLFDGLDFIRYDLTKDRPYQIFDTFYKEGIRDYCAFVLNLPNGSRQFVTLATKAEEGFPANLEQIIIDVAKILSTTLFAAYQTSVSISIATTYLGKTTGVRVLNGEISRGAQNQLEAGIMFCDIRGFTAMSEQLGAEGTIPILNNIFEKIAKEVTVRGGEILKFIGDAMLIIFPCTKAEERMVSNKMIEAAIHSVKGVEKIGEAEGLPLSIGFGCHIGTVLYGNIGAAERLDFTVMGPAVNLTSRLESLCKPMNCILTTSERVAQYSTKLTYLEEHSLKGIDNVIPVWGMKSK